MNSALTRIQPCRHHRSSIPSPSHSKPTCRSCCQARADITTMPHAAPPTVHIHIRHLVQLQSVILRLDLLASQFVVLAPASCQAPWGISSNPQVWPLPYLFKKFPGAAAALRSIDKWTGEARMYGVGYVGQGYTYQGQLGLSVMYCHVIVLEIKGVCTIRSSMPIQAWFFFHAGEYNWIMTTAIPYLQQNWLHPKAWVTSLNLEP